MKKKLSLLMVALVAIVAFAFQTTRRAEPVSINVPTETELGAFITEQIAANPGAPITLKLAAGGSYTMTTDCPQLPVDAAFAITSDAANPATITWANKPIRGGKGLTIENVIIDASAASGHIVSMNKPNAETWGEGQASGDQTYWTLEPYKFENVKILGLVKCILLDANDNGRFIFPEIVFNKCTIELRTGDDSKNVPVNISYGAVEKFTLANSTVYSKTPTTTYSNFLQLGGTRIWKAPGYESTAEAYITFENNTFYEVSLGGKSLINTNAYKGQPQAKFIFKKNIFANTPDASKLIYKQVTNTTNAANQITAEDNTYIRFGEGDPTYWNEVDLGSDEGIQDNPGFKDAANGDFTLALTSAQNVAKTGDPRWIQYSVTIADGVQNGSVVADVAAAKAGETVTLTATPAEGYELDAISVRGVTSDELVGVNDGKFTMPADAVTVSATFKPAPVDVEIAAADITEGKLTDAIVAKAAGKPIKNLTVTLAASTAYTVSAPIEAGANVVIAGPAELAEGETAPVIDASGLKETKVVDEVETTNYLPFIQMSTTPAVAANGKGSFMVDITIKDVTVNDVKSRFFYDNKKKYVAEHFSIDNCVIKLATAATVDGAIEFNQGGVMNFTMTNSTVYQTGEANVNYFTKYNNSIVPDNAIEGYETCNFWTYKNNTFHKISGNQWHNGGRIAQKASTMVVDIENNIWVDCCNDILRRMFGGNKKFSDFKEGSVLANNIFNKDGAVADQGSYGNGSDINGIVAFTDAANGDFNGNCKLALGATAPADKVGDPRWNVTYKESGVVLWSSEEPATIGWGEANITVAAEKFANAKVGDVMHVALQDIPAEAANPWDAQVELRGQNWKALEGAAFVAAPAKTAADFVLTGDILAIAKAQGIQINGTNCKTNLITLEYADKVAGSDASIWVGTATKENVILNKAHFANSNLFGGVKVGDKIRLTVKKTDPEGGEWIGLNYQTPSWVWSDFAEGSFATTITQTEEGAIIDFEVKTAEVAQILNADNAQIIVNNPNQTVTQVELIAAPEAPKFYIIGLNGTWDRTNMIEMTRNESGRYEYEFTTETQAFFAFADKQMTAEEAEADQDWSVFNSYRYSLGDGDVEYTQLGEIKSLVKGAANGTITLKPGTFKITVEPDFNAVTITGEFAPEPQPVDKLFIMGNGTTGGWDATTEMTFNEQTQAFEYTLEVSAGGAWFTFSDAAFDGNWDDFNANHRYAIGAGDVDATIGEALPLVKVNGTLAIKTAGTYNISVAKNLSTVTITSTGTGINSIAADKMENATIYTVSGQRVEKAQKGLYIIDGKKVVVK